MSINLPYVPLAFAGSAVITSLPISWPFLSTADLRVEAISSDGTVTSKALGVDFTAKRSAVGGTVTPLAAIGSGVTWKVTRVTSRTQPARFRTGGAFAPESVEAAVDRQLMILQELELELAASPVSGRPPYDVVSVTEFGARPEGIDSSAAFLQAAQAAASYKRPLWAPAGTFHVDEVQLPDGVTFYGAGEATVLMPYSAAGPGLLNILKLGNNCDVSRLHLYAPVATYGEKVGVSAAGRSGVRASQLSTDGVAVPALGTSCTGSRFERIKARNFLYNGVSFEGAGTNDCHIALCDVDGTAQVTEAHGVQVLNGQDCSAVGNRTVSTRGFGAYMGTCLDSFVDSNIARDTALEAFQTADSNRCVISGNLATWAPGKGTDFGISLWAPSTNPCNFNAILDNRLYNPCKSGISCEGSAGGQNAHTKISGNLVVNPNQAGDNFGAGVSLYGAGVFGTQVSDNKIVSTDGKMPYGVREASCDNNTIRGNTISGETTQKILRAGTGTIVANNGQTMTDAGTGWTPAVTAASGTITTLGTLIARSYEQEKMVHIACSIGITTIGTATGDIRVSLPYPVAAGSVAILSGYEVNTGASLRIIVGAFSTTTLSIRKYDGTAINLNNSTFQFSGWYERA